MGKYWYAALSPVQEGSKGPQNLMYGTFNEVYCTLKSREWNILSQHKIYEQISLIWKITCQILRPISVRQSQVCCPQKPKHQVRTFKHIRYICKLPTVERYDTEYSKYATPYHVLWGNVACAAPEND